MTRLIILLTIFFLLAGCVPATLTDPVAESASTPAYASPPVTGIYLPGDFIATEILGRPTDTTMTVNVVPAVEMELYYEIGTIPGVYTTRTESQIAEEGIPVETLLADLEPNQRYYYRIRYGDAAGVEHSFFTQRAPGSTFVFSVQADSHLNTDNHCNPELYRLNVLNIAADLPDFIIDLGDTFRTDKLKNINPTTIGQLYLDQRGYLGQAANSAPLFLVNGNHEMEWGWLLDGTLNNPSAWSVEARNRYFPQPAPDGFYTGNNLVVEPIGLLRDYYSWTWADALFVVIDPYWSTTTDPKQSGDFWDWTLGEAQYQWFRKTLEDSQAVYKFVFSHHVLGESRGGVEMAGFFEWGGRNRNGNWGFDDHRPGWGQPIHQVMVQNGVTIFFQGHDHLFARQELDGVIYQTVPMPANPNETIPNQDAYLSGVTRPQSGHLRVTVSPSQVTVDYIRAFLPQDENATRVNGMVDYSYSVR